MLRVNGFLAGQAAAGGVSQKRRLWQSHSFACWGPSEVVEPEFRFSNSHVTSSVITKRLLDYQYGRNTVSMFSRPDVSEALMGVRQVEGC
mmetsp:Transcript_36254/g.51298  ORF Transcript_36254/g.51298 Transcript_36254/m.51298 type:complete len:90 (-) Transcript_36254:134-403(-)